jgi:hypothetical protein
VPERLEPVELTVVDTNTAEWQGFRVDYLGVALPHIPLVDDPGTGMMVAKMTYPAGHTTPWHTHPCAHGVYVLAGTLNTHQGHYAPGTFVWFPESPRAAAARASASPMPEEAPVMNQVDSVRSVVLSAISCSGTAVLKMIGGHGVVLPVVGTSRPRWGSGPVATHAPRQVAQFLAKSLRAGFSEAARPPGEEVRVVQEETSSRRRPRVARTRTAPAT